MADAARPSTKTSLKYTYTEDERDDPFVPSVGSYLQASVEGAGERGWRAEGRGGGEGDREESSLCANLAAELLSMLSVVVFFVMEGLLRLPS